MSWLRRLLLGTLVVHLMTSASPSAALLVCVSDDGGASIELASPGAVRCDDSACRSAAAADDHSCRDIPVLSAGQAIAKVATVAVDLQAAPAAIAAAPPEIVAALPPDHDRAASAPARMLRSVVLAL